MRHAGGHAGVTHASRMRHAGGHAGDASGTWRGRRRSGPGEGVGAEEGVGADEGKGISGAGAMCSLDG